MKTLMVTDPEMCTECEACINACKKEYGVARARKTSTIPVFCMQCHPDKAPCSRICPTGAIENIDGTLKVNEDNCILCKLCLIACPIGIIAIDYDKGSAEKCTLCLESDKLIPACVEACKDNVLNIFSIEDLQELKDDENITQELEEAIKTFKTKS
ncbi:4Fe-4S dicluster domain-containing protein [Methanobrevibacter filiformis]|uniref:Iron-sulfur protein n=1 Tax=Methanobrevibacter filiformis TaxID=55758 RepID=A0A165Z8N2_9EURY|nr:4Fe-4S dicluster domain-containing protein [Methanobrevibacter filiformis]KZX10398.1 iron-sulfur protein [Methanobrevibacter filiformis]